MNKISVIIPVYNEAGNIGRLIEHLKSYAFQSDKLEIIVCDGGSTDHTTSEIRKHRDVKLISSEKGRAKQMNAAAKAAEGNILYFLHADSFPPRDFDKLIQQKIQNGQLAGCFKMKFNHDHWWLRLAGWFTRFNWRICRGGDQSLFVSKELFNKLKGFDESFEICEDNELIGRLYQDHGFTVIQEALITSARKYSSKGIWNVQFHFWMVHLKKRLGASPESLKSYYHKHLA